MDVVLRILLLLVLACYCMGNVFSCVVHAVVDELFDKDNKDGSE